MRSGALRSVGGAGAPGGAEKGRGADREGLSSGDALLRCRVSERRRSNGGGDRGQAAGSASGGGGVWMRGGGVARDENGLLSAMAAAQASAGYCARPWPRQQLFSGCH